MKIRSIATQLAASLATAAALGFASPAFAGPTSGYVLSFVTTPDPIYQGNTVMVDVRLTNDPDGLGYLAFDLLFDPAVLAFQSFSGVGFFEDEFTEAGAVGGSVITLLNDDNLAPNFDDGPIGTFTFTAIGVGNSTFGIGADPTRVFAFDQFLGFRDDISAIQSTITVLANVTNGVPLPGTALLAGLGLALLGWQRRPQRTSAAC